MSKATDRAYRRELRALVKHFRGKKQGNTKVVTNFMRAPGDNAKFPHPCDWPGCEKPWMFAKMKGRTVVAIRCHGHLEMGEQPDGKQVGDPGDVLGDRPGVDLHAGVGRD